MDLLDRLPILQFGATLDFSLKNQSPDLNEYNSAAPAGSKSSFPFLSRARFSVSFLLILSLSIPQSFLFPANPLPSLRDFNGLSLNFFNEETGRRFLKISYQKAIAEKKKLGFLRMNLAFLKVNDLSIEMDSRHTESSKILGLFQKVSQKRGVRYAVAGPINLTVKTPNSQIRITGDKGKFSTDGTLKVWGNVCMTVGETEVLTSKLSLSTDEANNAILLSPEGETDVVSIPLGNPDTTTSASDRQSPLEKQSTPRTR